MFNLFKKKSKTEVLEDRYRKLQEEAFALSKTNRTLSDQKYAEAEQVLKELEGVEG